MKLIDFRFVLRDSAKVLQVRHRAIYVEWGDKMCMRHSGLPFEYWSEWEDVPLVDLDEKAMP